MADESDRVRSIFLAAIEQHAPAGWSGFLDEACAQEPKLRGRVERLLRAQMQLGAFHEKLKPGRAATFDEPLFEQPGRAIGPYKLLEQIGEGGFGVVFMAEQQQPVRRKVALKVLKPGMDTKQVVTRFEAERQALALMDHPNIAKIHDAGTTEAGRPYFVMELVRGIPIMQFCDENRLTPRERLELFLTICQAVQHAHQKGVIHRDLKPSNVLVTLEDGRPIVKVIDFGIAKALGEERLTDKTLFTGFAQMIGSPLYMSPEQAEMGGQDADTRTDIYSLGVLLYELLTGTTPFDKERLKEASYDEIRRIIREEEPAKPSTRISTLGQAATTISANRKSEPRRLSQLFRGELDWIVMKALEKDRNRRYDTANSFAADVHRYMHDEPVQACPPSAGYRFRKFARRNKGTLLTATAVAMVVLLAVVGLATSTILIAQEQQRTATALRAETQAKDDLEQVLERERELREEERQNLYFQRIALADREWTANNLGRMEQLLDACPADLLGWEWYYLKRLQLEGIAPLRHAAAVFGAVFSPDGRWIVSGSQDGKVMVWDASTGQQRFGFQAHAGHVRDVALSPDGRFLATASWDGTARIWSFDPAGTEVKIFLHCPPLTGHQDRVQGVAFRPDGRRLASAGEDKTVRVWDVATGQEILPPLRGHTGLVWCVAYSPDGQWLASASVDRNVKIWDARTGQEKHTFPHRTAVMSVSFSQNGRWLAATTGDSSTKANGEIALWDVLTGQQIRTLRGHTGRILRAVFSPDGRRLASAGMDETVKLWDLRTGEEVLTLRDHRGVVRSVDFSPDGARLLSASLDRTVRIWDAQRLGNETGQAYGTLVGHRAGVRSVAFSPDGRWLASAGDDDTVRVWDPRLGRARDANPLIRILDDCPGFTNVVFSHHGQWLAAAGRRSDLVKFWKTMTWEVLSEQTKGRAPLAFSANDRYLATWRGNYLNFIIKIRDTMTGEEISTLRNHRWAIFDLAFSPKEDAPLLASASVDGTVRIWDAKTGKEIVAPLQHSQSVLCVAFSPDARLLASAGSDRVLSVWDTQSWERLQQLPDSTGSVQSVVFHPTDSRVLAWGSSDGTVKVWNRTTNEVRTLRGHTSWVESVAFSPDGEWLASASLDETVKIWKTPPLHQSAGGAEQ